MNPKHGVVYRFTYAVGFLIGALYALLVWPFYHRRMKKFIAQDLRYNG